MLKNGEIYATEIKYTIIATDIDKAKEMLMQIGQNPDDFVLDYVGIAKDSNGNYLDEQVIKHY